MSMTCWTRWQSIENLNGGYHPEIVLKIGEFIYPWGSGHYSRMMRFNEALHERAGGGMEIHMSSKDHIYEQLLERFPGSGDRIHEILMPTPIDGPFGPSLAWSLANLLLPVRGSPSLVRQVVDYLREERRLYDSERFDLVVNDGDMGSNILARNRSIPCLFITNQFRPRLHGIHSYLYPALLFVSKQISKASKILVADSPPPYTLCEYNLNFPDWVRDRVEYVGHFAGRSGARRGPRTDIEDLVDGVEFGYWMRTGNRATNDGTGRRYEETFRRDEMRGEKRVVSHAREDPSIGSVTGTDGRTYSISEAAEKNVDWIQIDVGFLSEQEKDTVLEQCRYAVVNGSHTVMGEIMGGKSKPIVGIPVYDEHTNNIRWAEEKNLGLMAANAEQAARAVRRINTEYAKFEECLAEFSANFMAQGACNAAGIAASLLDGKR